MVMVGPLWILWKKCSLKFLNRFPFLVLKVENLENSDNNERKTLRSKSTWEIGANIAFWLAAYIVRLFDSHFSLVYRSGLLARKMGHHTWQSDSNQY